MIKCSICGKKIKTNKKLTEHIAQKHKIELKEYFIQYLNSTKYCSKCKKELPITNFFKDNSVNSGYKSRCVNCLRPNRDNIICPICGKITTDRHIVTHLIKSHDMSQEEAYEKQGGKKCSICKKTKSLSSFSKLKNENYYSLCKECNTKRNKENAIERGIEKEKLGTIKQLIVRLSFKDKCFLCGTTQEESIKQYKQSLHLDHNIPYSRNGKLVLNNIILLCRQCNMNKSDKTFEEYLNHIGYTLEQITDKLKDLENIIEIEDQELNRIYYSLAKQS